jgi:hypothetical protein
MEVNIDNLSKSLSDGWLQIKTSWHTTPGGQDT